MSGRVHVVDRGGGIWAWEDGLVVWHSTLEVHLDVLKRWGIWRWRRAGGRTPGRPEDHEGRDKEQAGGAAKATGRGLYGKRLKCLSWRMSTGSWRPCGDLANAWRERREGLTEVRWVPMGDIWRGSGEDDDGGGGKERCD